MRSLLADEPTAETSPTFAPDIPAPAFASRQTPASWPATQRTREQAAELLASAPFAVSVAERRGKRTVGVKLLLDWLADQPGETWQDRWHSSGAEQAARGWRRLPITWLGERGHGPWHQEAIAEALPVAISADLARPSLPWLVGGGLARGGRLVPNLEASRDPEGLARLRSLCHADDRVSAAAATQTLYRSALILAAKGGDLTQVRVGDVVELLDTEANVLANTVSRGALFYGLLRTLGVLGPEAPAMTTTDRGM
jgi:hypothetical protein